MKTSELPVIVKQQFANNIDVVWDAITQHHEMIHWFFNLIPNFKAEVGFKTQFNVQTPSRDFFHLWEITEVVPLNKIVYNWKYKGMKGDSLVKFELAQTEEITELTLTTEVLEDFDDSIIEFRRDSCEGGWNYFIKECLVHYLKEKR